MGAPVKPVKGVRVNLNAEFMGNGRDMHDRVGGAGDCGMYHDGILKALQCDNVSRRDALVHQLEQLLSGVIGGLPQFRRRCRHQGGSGKH